MSSVSNRVPLRSFLDPYVTLLEQVRAEGKKSYQNDANIVPLYYRGPIISLQPVHISEIKPLPLLPSTLSPAKDQSYIPPRAFYGFQLALSDAVRILKKVRYLEYASFPADVSNKEAFLEDYITTLFPAFVDRYIEFLHKELNMELIGFIPTFFADVLGDDKEIVLFTIGDSWRSKPFLAPIIQDWLIFWRKMLPRRTCHIIILLRMGMGSGGSRVMRFSGLRFRRPEEESVR